MLLILTQLKTICRLLTSLNSVAAAGLLLLGIGLFSEPLAAESFADLWPFQTDSDSVQKIENRVETAELSVSTRYFARGPQFKVGQRWNDATFLQQLEKQNFRLREGTQSLLAGDAKKIESAECLLLLLPDQRTEIASGVKYCWIWQNHRQENYVVAISDQSRILATNSGLPWKAHWHAALDPILVAQFRGQEPIMQHEYKIANIPVDCMNAVIAIEDNDFLDHSGVSYTGMTRSFVKNVIKMRAAQGGSTITQQLVKNYFLTPEKSLKRKLREIYLAIKLESQWTKDEILETYLNIIYMGQSGAFQVRGFGAAAEVYFGKPLPNLNLSECSLLAGLLNNPAQNNPWKKAEKALARRNAVLKKMLDLKLIAETEFTAATQASLPKVQVAKAVETAPYFFDAVRKQMIRQGIAVEGAQIFTSLDLDAQTAAQKSLLAHISELEANRKNLQTNKESGRRLEGLVLAAENLTGLVTVVVGGQNYRQTQFNRAVDSHRQIGSLIKPFIYLTALVNGIEGAANLNPETRITDEKFEWLFDKKKWSPENYDKKFNGDVPLYFALKESLNAAAARLAQKVQLGKIITTLKSIGFTSKMVENPSLSLGASEHYPMEVLQAYQTLANFGNYQQPSFIERIEDSNSRLVYEFQIQKESRLDPMQTQVLVGMMQETLKSGTAKSAKALGWDQPSAGKTGTTSDNKDAWFAGFTPHQTAVVWLGYDQSLSSKLTGGSGAVPIWLGLMKTYNQVWFPDDFLWSEAVEKRFINLFRTNLETELVFKR